jgi:(S)-3,5-dihydroxyphenylglycine transaminase
MRAHIQDHDLSKGTLHSSLSEPSLESMNFLNEVASRHPEAISFASGRPFEGFFDVTLIQGYIETFARYLKGETGCNDAQVNQAIFQYGRTKGIIHELVARQLARDEDIRIDPEAIVVTVGCQEAMFITVRALRTDERDILLAVSPTYIGITGAARLVDMPVWPVRSGPSGIDLHDLAAQVRQAREAGLHPRACYVMADFANPSGVSLTVQLRQDLLGLAASERILLLEDNPYGLFHDGSHLPTLKALDTTRQVIYLGSFAKTGFPGARVGYAVADQRVAAADGGPSLLADELAKIKSMVTVNTSAVAQAVVGGKLLRHEFSMAAANQRETAVYLGNLKHLLAGLRQRFPGGDITWNCPSGGFFVVVTLPFAADDKLVERSAREYGVLWTPMSHFYEGAGGLRQVRLACSQLTPELIETGLDRFAAFVASQRQGRLPWPVLLSLPHRSSSAPDLPALSALPPASSSVRRTQAGHGLVDSVRRRSCVSRSEAAGLLATGLAPPG